jgi:pyridoxal phosphate enzyme (YggS family)
MERLKSTVARNLAAVRERIARAAERAGRSPSNVRLVGITKYVTSREIAALVDVGCTDLGESRPQQLWQRAEECQSLGVPLQWHLVGHLQRNKVSRTLEVKPVLHGVDSERLLATLEAEAAQQGVRPTVLVEVNCSGEAAKHGFSPDELRRFAPNLAQFKQLEIRGLMTMAAYDAPASQVAATFATLRRLRDELRTQLPSGFTLPELSMGMSGDFEIAIAEGATMVRVGSALWEGIV